MLGTFKKILSLTAGLLMFLTVSAKADVVVGETYHIKLAVADASDNILDSAVFIEAGSSDTWYKYSGENDLIFGINLFGESGKGNDVYAHFGLEEKQILKKIMEKFF